MNPNRPATHGVTSCDQFMPECSPSVQQQQQGYKPVNIFKSHWRLVAVIAALAVLGLVLFLASIDMRYTAEECRARGGVGCGEVPR
jgi:hypothetical protein